MGEVESVSIQIGNGTLTPPTPDSSSSGSGNVGTNPGTNSGSGGSLGNNAGGSGDNNRDQGLYDETTRFTNDPSNAQKIDSSIIDRDKTSALHNNFGKGTASVIAGKKDTIGNIIGQAKGKVSVISPENGPESIVVSKDNALGDNQSDSLLSGMGGDNSGGNGNSVWGENDSLDNGSEEILLDQKNGGAVDNKKNGIGKKIVIFGGALAGSVSVVGGGIFLLAKRGDWMLPGAAKKRKRRRKKRKAVNRKNPVNRQRPANVKKPVKRNRKPASARRGDARGTRKPVSRKRRRRPVRK